MKEGHVSPDVQVEFAKWSSESVVAAGNSSKQSWRTKPELARDWRTQTGALEH